MLNCEEMQKIANSLINQQDAEKIYEALVAAYMNGKNIGYNKGYMDAGSKEFDKGFRCGYNAGHCDGYRAGADDAHYQS